MELVDVSHLNHISRPEENTEILRRETPKDLSEWKAEVEEAMLQMKERISKLERQKLFDFSSDPRSFATAEDDGCGGLRTCIRLIQTKKASLFQCIWLAIIITIFLTLGITQFQHAKNNVNSEFKPEKKYKTINYGDEDNDIMYEMPYVYLFFNCRSLIQDEDNENYWTYDRLDKTISALLEAQNYFLNATSISYANSDYKMWSESLLIEEAIVLYEDAWVDGDSFLGYFRLKLSDPEPSLGTYRYTITMDMQNMSLDSTIWLDGFYVAVAREFDTLTWEETIYLPIDGALLDGSEIFSTVEYDEKVVSMYDNEELVFITTSLGGYWESDYDEDLAIFQLSIRGNPLVEYWEEYVAYDLIDWFFGMGGLLSISSVVFFWVAYYLSMFFGEKSTMGILPEFSFAFYNLEHILLLSEKLS